MSFFDSEKREIEIAAIAKPTARAVGCNITAGVTPKVGSGPKSGRAFKQPNSAKQKPIKSKTYLPKEKEWMPLLDNYLRYKGPNKEFKNELDQYTLIKKIIKI